MEAAIQKKATMFRLPEDLIMRLKEMAKHEHRSLNNFVECVLANAAYHNAPKQTTNASATLIESDSEKSLTSRLCESLQEVKLIREGKAKAYTVEELLNEL